MCAEVIPESRIQAHILCCRHWISGAREKKVGREETKGVRQEGGGRREKGGGSRGERGGMKEEGEHGKNASAQHAPPPHDEAHRASI